MPSERLTPEIYAPATRWWILIVRGVAAIGFGMLAFVAPELSLLAMIVLWGAYAFIDGGANLAFAAWSPGARGRRGWLVVAGLVSIAAGVVAFAWPAMTGFALLTVIAAWAIVMGVVEILMAVQRNRETSAEWLLAVSGVLSTLFGVLLLAFPGTGALALAWMIGSFALAFGVLLVALGWSLRRWTHATPHTLRPATPSAA